MAGKKDIGIFELAELFDITPEAIRKYEAKGIIRPHRNEENRYRKYSSWEVVKLAVSRGMSMEGFSLNQVADMLETQELDEHVRMLEALQEKIAREIVYKKRLISLIDRHKKEYYGSIGREGRMQIEHVSALYCCKLTENGQVVDKKGEELSNLKAWIAALPFVGMCFVYNEVFEMCTCLAISEEDMERFGLTHLTPEFVVAAQMCVVYDMTIERNAAYYSVFDTLNAAAEKVKELGFRVEETRYMWLYAYTQKNDSYRSYVKGLFPIVT